MKRTVQIGFWILASLSAYSPCCRGQRAVEFYVISWETLDSGGGISASEAYANAGTLGQTVVGESSVSNYTVAHGYPADVRGQPHPSGDELIVNGSFEQTGGAFVPDAYGVMSLPVGSTMIPGWTTTTAELAWGNDKNTFRGASPFGAYWLDLTGYHDNPAYAGVTQTIVTSPGEPYRLSLSLGSNADFPDAGGLKSVVVSANASSNTFTMKPTNATGNQWGQFSFDFTASSSTTVVTIQGMIASGIYLGLDNVSVTRHQPELVFTTVERIENNLRLRFHRLPGQTVKLQLCSDLLSGIWTDVPGATVSGIEPTDSFAIPINHQQSSQLFRLSSR